MRFLCVLTHIWCSSSIFMKKQVKGGAKMRKIRKNGYSFCNETHNFSLETHKSYFNVQTLPRNVWKRYTHENNRMELFYEIWLIKKYLCSCRHICGTKWRHMPNFSKLPDFSKYMCLQLSVWLCLCVYIHFSAYIKKIQIVTFIFMGVSLL